MRTTYRYLSALSTLLVAGMVAHASAAAQGTRLLSAPTISPAEQLEMLAEQPIVNGQWLPSAKDLEQAARLRPATDPTAVWDLMSAATLYTSMGRDDEALALLVTAGDRARRIGDNELTFRTYLAGLGVAEQAEDASWTHFYLNHLVAVVKRPGVTAEQKNAVLEAERYAELEL